MVKLMVDSTTSMLRSWESRIENEGGIADIKINDDLRSLSSDIISRACFGSNYSQGEEIFLKLFKESCPREMLEFLVLGMVTF